MSKGYVDGPFAFYPILTFKLIKKRAITTSRRAWLEIRHAADRREESRARELGFRESYGTLQPGIRRALADQRRPRYLAREQVDERGVRAPEEHRADSPIGERDEETPAATC
jgi:hypothetical protein